MAVSQRKNKTLVDIKSINELFLNGKAVQNYPVRAHYLLANETKILFSVSKKKIPKAVDRNRTKRILREIYFKTPIKEKNNKYHIGFIYLSSKLMSYEDLSQKMQILMNKIYK